MSSILILSYKQGKIVIGHSIASDMKSLDIKHPPRDIRDTTLHPWLMEKAGYQSMRLKRLCQLVLGMLGYILEESPISIKGAGGIGLIVILHCNLGLRNRRATSPCVSNDFANSCFVFYLNLKLVFNLNHYPRLCLTLLSCMVKNELIKCRQFQVFHSNLLVLYVVWRNLHQHSNSRFFEN